MQTSEDGKPLFMRLTPIKGFTKQSFVAWAEKSLAPNAHVVSDGLLCFTQVTQLGSSHERYITGGGRKAAQTPQLRWVATWQSSPIVSIVALIWRPCFPDYYERLQLPHPNH